MKIRDVMSSPGVTVPPQASVSDAARQMAYEGVGSVLVVDDGRLVGIVTDRDLALRVVGRSLPGDTPIIRVMSTDVVVVHPENDIDEVFHAFRRNAVRRLPVLDGTDVVGMIAVDDLLVLSHRYQADLLGPVVSELDEPQQAPA